MFKALYNHVNNIIEKYLQIYNHILIYLQWIKKEKLKLKQLLNHMFCHPTFVSHEPALDLTCRLL